jgi:hypothetical protein
VRVLAIVTWHDALWLSDDDLRWQQELLAPTTSSR